MSVICYMSVICLVLGGVIRVRLYDIYLGVGMSTPDTQTALYAEDRGLQVPMALEHGNIVGTQCCDTLSHVS
jgi:hypothetical protein